MPKKKPTTLTPKRRFSEFRDAPGWEVKNLGDICRIQTGKKDANQGCEVGPYPFFTCAENHIYSQSYSFDAEAMLVAGNANVGLTKYYKGKFEAYQRTYVLTDFEDINVDYLYAVLSTSLRPALLAQVQSSAMSYIKLPMLKGFGVSIPPLYTEQQKIADCLGSLDDWIAAAGRKLAALRDHRRGLLQQLFPKPGQSQPQQRFPEFRKAGAWKVKTFPEIAKNLNSKRVPITENQRTKGEVPYYGASGIVDYVEGHIFDEDLLCISEDGANLVARTYPIAFSISGKTWVNNHAHVLRFKKRFTQTVVEAYLNFIDLKDFITGMAQPKLNRTMLDTIPIPLPEEPEQQKIAACLTALDTQIAAQAAKLDTLHQHKRGLMQQLFPSPEDQT